MSGELLGKLRDYAVNYFKTKSLYNSDGYYIFEPEFNVLCGLFPKGDLPDASGKRYKDHCTEVRDAFIKEGRETVYTTLYDLSKYQANPIPAMATLWRCSKVYAYIPPTEIWKELSIVDVPPDQASEDDYGIIPVWSDDTADPYLGQGWIYVEYEMEKESASGSSSYTASITDKGEFHISISYWTVLTDDPHGKLRWQGKDVISLPGIYSPNFYNGKTTQFQCIRDCVGPLYKDSKLDVPYTITAPRGRYRAIYVFRKIPGPYKSLWTYGFSAVLLKKLEFEIIAKGINTNEVFLYNDGQLIVYKGDKPYFSTMTSDENAYGQGIYIKNDLEKSVPIKNFKSVQKDDILKTVEKMRKDIADKKVRKDLILGDEYVLDRFNILLLQTWISQNGRYIFSYEWDDDLKEEHFTIRTNTFMTEGYLTYCQLDNERKRTCQDAFKNYCNTTAYSNEYLSFLDPRCTCSFTDQRLDAAGRYFFSPSFWENERNRLSVGPSLPCIGKCAVLFNKEARNDEFWYDQESARRKNNPCNVTICQSAISVEQGGKFEGDVKMDQRCGPGAITNVECVSEKDCPIGSSCHIRPGQGSACFLNCTENSNCCIGADGKPIENCEYYCSKENNENICRPYSYKCNVEKGLCEPRAYNVGTTKENCTASCKKSDTPVSLLWKFDSAVKKCMSEPNPEPDSEKIPSGSFRTQLECEKSIRTRYVCDKTGTCNMVFYGSETEPSGFITSQDCQSSCKESAATSRAVNTVLKIVLIGAILGLIIFFVIKRYRKH